VLRLHLCRYSYETSGNKAFTMVLLTRLRFDL